MHKKKNNLGHSLVELLIVIGILAFLAAIGIPYFYHSRSLLYAEVDHLAMTIIELRNRALVTNTEQRLMFQLNKQSYTYNNQSHTLHHTIKFGFLPGTKGPPSSPAKPVINPITFTNNTIVFYPTGITDSGTIYIIDSSTKFMYAISIGVSQVSYMRKYRYDQGWKLLE